jgi:hypothetical protein
MFVKSIKSFHAIVAAVGLEAANHLQAQLVEVTVGNATEDRPFNDSSVGQVTIYGGSGFQIGGVVRTWSFFSSGASNRAITPLLFERAGDTDFVLRAMGASRTILGDGIHTFAFDPEAGEPEVAPAFTFGFTDRVAYVPEVPSTNPIVTVSQNAGVVDFGYAAGGQWCFTSNEVFDLRLGQVYRLGGVTTSTVVRLQQDLVGHRLYSAQMSAIGARPMLRVSIHHTGEICWPSILNKLYQLQWQPTLDVPWENLGLPIPGNGSTNCVLDSPGDSAQRFYRVVALP